MNRAQVHPVNIIEVKNVTVYRGETQVFSGLSLEIPVDCHTAILGPNGAGKTTLLKLLSQEIYPVRRAGSYVRIFGQEHWSVWELRRRLGIVSHDLQHEHPGHIRGRDVILSGYYSCIGVHPHQAFSAEDLERVCRVMDGLGVMALGDRMFSEMSTGEQRRFLLGRALVHDPKALVLDEPTSGLDLKARFQYLDIVRSLMRMGKTIILVTHHIHEILPELSRIVLLKDGKVMGDGQKQEILTASNLRNLFGVRVDLVHLNGWYQALPGGGSEE